MSDLFTIILFLWSMVALFVVAQLIIMMFTPMPHESYTIADLEADINTDEPVVFFWRRK
jgi:hypothetical protein